MLAIREHGAGLSGTAIRRPSGIADAAAVLHPLPDPSVGKPTALTDQPIAAGLGRLVRRAAGVDRRASAVGDGVLVFAELEELARRVGSAALVGHPLLGRHARTEASRFGELARVAGRAGGGKHDRRLRKLRHGRVVL